MCTLVILSNIQYVLGKVLIEVQNNFLNIYMYINSLSTTIEFERGVYTHLYRPFVTTICCLFPGKKVLGGSTTYIWRL